jgi:hypothetical protein
VQLANAIVQACTEIDQGWGGDPEQGVGFFARQLDPDAHAGGRGTSKELLTKTLIRYQLSHRSLDASLAHDPTSLVLMCAVDPLVRLP